MFALITGASSGIGRDMARELAGRGYDLILTARREDRLRELAVELEQSNGVECKIIATDLGVQENCCALYESLKNTDIDIVINNAGFGAYGDFKTGDLKNELDLIALNVTSLHILTKLFIQDFAGKNKGRILNVASIAGFMPGPKMAAYYASKNYVLNLSLAIYEELRHNKSKVSISCLCPGPVRTEFNDVANVKFGINSISSEKAAKIAIRKMFNGKLIIIPGFINRAAVFASRFVSRKMILRLVYRIQKLKK